MGIAISSVGLATAQGNAAALAAGPTLRAPGQWPWPLNRCNSTRCGPAFFAAANQSRYSAGVSANNGEGNSITARASTDEIVAELRDLIVKAAPDPAQAQQVRSCGPDELLDAIIPFSSVILLGVVVAIEDRYAIRVTRESLTNACAGGTTLRKLALMIEQLKTASQLK